MTSRSTIASDSIPLWLLILLAIAWILPGLVGHEPWKPDEAYSFGLVYHILQTGDWVVPTLAGEPFMEKPPLFYITAALFAKIFSAWLPLHDGARLAAGFYMAFTLLFTGLAARELSGHGRTAVLALLACLGLAPWAHLLITDTALLAGLALGLYGFALGLRKPIHGGLCLGTGAGIAFLSKGLLGPGLLGLAALVLPTLHRTWRTRAYLMSLLVAVVASLPWLLIWPIALYLRSPELFGVWLWDNNFGRFFGTSGLGPKSERFFYLRTLSWFAWPVWLLALWGLWRIGRDGLRQPSVLLPLTTLAVMLLTLMGASDARQVYALPLLLPLTLLSARAMDFLSGRTEIMFYALGVTVTLIALLLPWGIWISLIQGVALFTALDPPSTPPPVFSWSTAIAILLSLGGLFALYVLRRQRERTIATWAIAATLFSGLVMTLLLDTIDGQKSYRDTMTSLKNALPAAYDCVTSEGLGEPQRAMIEYYAGIQTLRRTVHPDAKCQLMLRQEWVTDSPAYDSRQWHVLWVGQRPGDTKEKFRLYQRL